MLQDWVAETTPNFRLDPERCALLVVDMQYASACRTTGIGKLLAERGQADSLKYRFDRIESLVVPSIQKLLRYFRERNLKIVYLTLGSERIDYEDLLPRIRVRARMIRQNMPPRCSTFNGPTVVSRPATR